MAFNNKDLDDLLKQDRAPARSDDHWNSFPGRVTAQLQRPVSVSKGTSATNDRRHRISSGLALGLGLGLACLVLALKYGAGTQPDPGRPAAPLGAQQAKSYAKIIEEVGAMFPNRVRSVALNDNDIHLNLADHDDVATSPPIWLEICRGGHCQEFITFSGQQIRVDRDLYEVLVDSRGNVMLAGEKMIWSNAGHVADGPGARFAARLL